MQFAETGLAGAFLVALAPIADERGFFARTWCRKEFTERGLQPEFVQCSTSFSKRKGTLRGLHYQAYPHAETKLVRCTRGAIYDVIVDLRPASPTFRHWFGGVLSVENERMMYIPEGFAHGFVTLENDTEVFYQMSAYYHPAAARGVRWNDPAFGISWPVTVEVISPKDRDYGDFRL